MLRICRSTARRSGCIMALTFARAGRLRFAVGRAAAVRRLAAQRLLPSLHSTIRLRGTFCAANARRPARRRAEGDGIFCHRVACHGLLYAGGGGPLHGSFLHARELRSQLAAPVGTDIHRAPAAGSLSGPRGTKLPIPVVELPGSHWRGVVYVRPPHRATDGLVGQDRVSLVNFCKPLAIATGVAVRVMLQR